MSKDFHQGPRNEQTEVDLWKKEEEQSRPLGSGSRDRDLERPPAPGPAATAAKSAGQVRVLLAEDHDLVRRSIAELIAEDPELELVGEAANGEEAIVLAHERHPDVLVMDLSLPGISGIEATRQLTREAPETRIIAFSIHAEQEVSEALQDAGASAFVSKAQAPEHLIRTIREVGGKGA